MPELSSRMVGETWHHLEYGVGLAEAQWVDRGEGGPLLLARLRLPDGRRVTVEARACFLHYGASSASERTSSPVSKMT